MENQNQNTQLLQTGFGNSTGAGPSTHHQDQDQSQNQYKNESDEEEGSDSKKRRKGSPGDDGHQRVQLACFHCRVKRIRCSGTKPVCEACKKTNERCEWPSGRRRKRTRKEMEEARKLEAVLRPPEGAASAQEDMYSDMFSTNFDISSVFNGPSTSTFVWPSGFTPDANGQIPIFPFDPPPDMPNNPELPGMTDPRLISALEKQTAFIEGDPGGQDLELFYYRMSGPTAVHPGVNRISLKLQRRSAESPYATAPQPESNEIPGPNPSDLFDASGMPFPHIYTPLFELFFQHMSQYFPSTSRKRMNERFESGTMSQFLANCICALGARFSESARSNPAKACAPFIAKAQELIIPLLHLPTSDVCTGLLFLAWACYGQNSESGLWQFSGMSIRMAIDLGFHEQIEMYESPAHLVRTRLLFWSMFITDRIIAFATGRPASIPEDVIEIPLPEDQDFFPDPSRDTGIGPIESVEPIPFVQLTKLMVICGRISNVLNGRRGRARTLVNTNEPLAEQLAELQVRLVQFVSGLPPSLQWTAENFKHQQARGHGGSFLSLHLWANAVLALVYHPELLKSPTGFDTPLSRSMSRSIKLALASSRQISECMVFADLVAESAFTSSPYIVQPLYVASMALIHDMRASQASLADTSSNPSTPNPTNTSMFFVTMSRQNLSALLKALQRLEHYWAGAMSVASILEKRSGIPRTTPRLLPTTFISLPDRGLLRRFTADRDHPQNVAPPTETSMREAQAKSERSGSGPSPYWLADLMSGYTVENMSFGPADSSDLERLLGTANMDGFGNPNAGMMGAGTGGSNHLSGISGPSST